MNSPLAIPTLETARLRLRAHRPNDLAAAAAMWGDPAVTEFIGGNTFTSEEVWSRMLRYAGHWAWFGYGFWALDEKETGAFIGELGFADFRRDTIPPLGDQPELGWVLASHAHGQGFATEAVRAALSWGDGHFDGRRTLCIIDPEHRRSLNVATKVGYCETSRVAYHGQTRLVLTR